MARVVFFVLLLAITTRYSVDAASDPDFAEFEDDGEFDFDLPEDEFGEYIIWIAISG